MKLSTIVSYGAGTAGLSGLWVAAVTAAPGDAPALLVVAGPAALVGLSGLSLALVAVARPDRQAPDWQPRQVPSPRPVRPALPAREVTR